MRWRSYVAVGDSFTEGLDDPRPTARLPGLGRPRRRRPARRREAAGFQYANLAIRGRLFDAIVDEQVPAALRMRPDLISFAGGGNDVLRRNFDPAAMLARFDDVVRTLRATGADVIIFRWADVTSRLPGRRMILPRMEVLNQAVGEVAERHGAILVDLWHDEEFHNPRCGARTGCTWRRPGTAGSPRTCSRALGRRARPDLARPPGPRTAPELGRGAGAATPAGPGSTWRPWVQRRLTGRSSGDTVTAKRPSPGSRRLTRLHVGLTPASLAREQARRGHRLEATPWRPDRDRAHGSPDECC